MAQVPLIDLGRQYRAIQPELDRAVLDVAASQQFILGPAVARFEASLKRYFGAASALGVSSGSDALLLALWALEIGPGDEVITTPFTFYATAAAIARSGARPVFVDIDPATYNLSPARVEAAVTSRTRAIMPVHLYGQPADLDPLLEIARRGKMAVIEDAAQAIGAVYRGKKAGTLGNIGCFSAYPTKNLGAFGDAGFVVTDDPALADRIGVLRDNGNRKKYHHERLGWNCRLDAMQAAVLDVKLKHLDDWNARRARLAERYAQGLAGSGVALPAVQAGATHVYHQYVVLSEDRDALMEHLKAQGVGCQVYYPVPLHLQECFSGLGHRPGDFPVSERVARQCLALPIFPEMDADEQEQVIGSVRSFKPSRRMA